MNTAKRLSRVEVLEAIKELGPITTNELSEFHGVTNNAIRKHIEDLRIDGWTFTTASAGNGTSAKNYTYGGKPKKTDGSDLVTRCYHLVKALRTCNAASVRTALGVSEERARELLTEVGARYNHELTTEITVSCKQFE